MKQNNLYYRLWVSIIQNYLRTHIILGNGWKYKMLFIISSIFGLGFWTILIWLKYFNIFIIRPFSIDIFPGTYLNSVFSFFFTFVLPFFLINFFLIFKNNRYETLLNKYNEIKKLHFIIMMMVIIWGAFISFAIISLLK